VGDALSYDAIEGGWASVMQIMVCERNVSIAAVAESKRIDLNTSLRNAPQRYGAGRRGLCFVVCVCVWRGSTHRQWWQSPTVCSWSKRPYESPALRQPQVHQLSHAAQSSSAAHPPLAPCPPPLPFPRPPGCHATAEARTRRECLASLKPVVCRLPTVQQAVCRLGPLFQSYPPRHRGYDSFRFGWPPSYSLPACDIVPLSHHLPFSTHSLTRLQGRTEASLAPRDRAGETPFSCSHQHASQNLSLPHPGFSHIPINTGHLTHSFASATRRRSPLTCTLTTVQRSDFN